MKMMRKKNRKNSDEKNGRLAPALWTVAENEKFFFPFQQIYLLPSFFLLGQKETLGIQTFQTDEEIMQYIKIMKVISLYLKR